MEHVRYGGQGGLSLGVKDLGLQGFRGFGIQDLGFRVGVYLRFGEDLQCMEEPLGTPRMLLFLGSAGYSVAQDFLQRAIAGL